MSSGIKAALKYTFSVEYKKILPVYDDAENQKLLTFFSTSFSHSGNFVEISAEGTAFNV